MWYVSVCERYRVDVLFLSVHTPPVHVRDRGEHLVPRAVTLCFILLRVSK